MGTKTSRHTRLALCVLFFMMATQVYGGIPTGPFNVSISPPNPTSQDIVAITASGEWSDSCIPDASFIWVYGNNVFFEVYRSSPINICLQVIVGWQQTNYVGPLSPGVYILQTQLSGYPMYTQTTQFTVSGPAERHVSSEYSTIQAAINASSNGDVVIVAPGTYYENINMKNGVTVKGAGADVTTIDGGENGHVVVFNLASGTISGFTITNSGHNPLYVGGIFTSQCNVRIENNIVVNNNKGIILSSNSTAVIAGNQIINNTGRGIQLSSSYATIANNVIAGNSYAGIYCDNSSPLIVNNTIYDNGHYGISCNPISTQVIFNNIITHNEYGIMALGGGESPVSLLEISHNDVWNNSKANYWYEWAIICFPEDPYCEPDGASEPFEPQPGTGEISQDPLFANPNNDDYHLKSQAGRWNPNSQSWVTDANTSPCIDAGDPNSDWTKELWPNGKRINIGAYGGTLQASMSLSTIGNIANLDNDPCDIVNLNDLAVFVEKWCFEEYLLSEDLDRDGHVDFNDFAIFAEKYDETHRAEPNIIYNIGLCTQGLSQNTLLDQFDQTRVTVTVEGKHIHFEDMMVANCCTPLSNLWLEMTVNDNLLTIYEHEELPQYPCRCICDYPINANLGPFATGTYTLEVYEDYGGFIGSTTFTIE